MELNKKQIKEIAKAEDIYISSKLTRPQMIDILTRELDARASLIRAEVYHHKTFSRAYFWTSPATADGRRRMERENTVDKVYTHKGIVYYYESQVQCSCRNVYYSSRFFAGTKQGDLRVWRKLLASVEALRDEMAGQC